MERKIIAKWFAAQVLETSDDPVNEVEWLVHNLYEGAFKDLREFYALETGKL